MEVPNHLSYLTKSTQRIKMGSAFSDWANIVKGILQGSILGHLHFNILSMIFCFSQQNVLFCVIMCYSVILLMTIAFILVV